MNTNLLNVLKEIVSRYGGVGTLSDARRVKALLSDLAAGEPKPHKNALIACIEQGFVPALQNVPAGERGAAKAKLAERLNREEGLDLALCADTLDLLEAALAALIEEKPPEQTKVLCKQCGKELQADWILCPYCGMAVHPASRNTPHQQPVTAYSAQYGKEVWHELRTLWDTTSRFSMAPDWRKIAAVVYRKKYDKAKTIKIWDMESGRELHVLEGHTDHVCSVAYSPDGRRIVSGSRDKTIKIWDVESGRELYTLKGAHSIYSVAYSPDGRRIVSGGYGNIIKIWDAESGRELHVLEGHTDTVFSVAYSPDGRRIVSGGYDNAIKIWDAESGRKRLTLTGHTDWVTSVAYSSDGRRIVSKSSSTLKIWDAESGREIQIIDPGYSVAYSPDGSRIVSESVDKTLKIWDAESGREIQTLYGHDGAVYSVAYSPDGRRIVSGSRDKTLKIWDAESGREIQTLYGHDDYVYSVAYSPDGRRILSWSADNTIKIWGRED